MQLVLTVILVFLMIVFVIDQYNQFNQVGLDSGIVSEPEEYLEAEESSEIEYRIVGKNKLIISNMYVIERGDQIQLRFRVAYPWPFAKDNLFFETEWENGNTFVQIYYVISH